LIILGSIIYGVCQFLIFLKDKSLIKKNQPNHSKPPVNYNACEPDASHDEDYVYNGTLRSYKCYDKDGCGYD